MRGLCQEMRGSLAGNEGGLCQEMGVSFRRRPLSEGGLCEGGLCEGDVSVKWGL